ncbi:MAG: type II secretion system protein, partial [Acidobacteriota bacterium]
MRKIQPDHLAKEKGRVKKSIITNSRGFSLLELLTVAAIIALLAGFFYPYLLVSTMTTNEKTTVATIRTIFQA